MPGASLPPAMTKTPLWCAAIALALAVRATGADPDFWEPADPLIRANAAFARGEATAAEALAAPLTTGAGARADACLLLGEIRMSQKRGPEAVELFRQAVRICPGGSGYQVRLGNGILQIIASMPEADRGRLMGEAMGALRRAIEIDPNNSDAYQGLAYLYAAIPEAAGGGYEKAIGAATEMKKRQALDGAITAAMISEQHGKLEAALGFWREALHNYSGDAGLRGCEPRVLASLGRIAEARQCYLKILVDFPDDENAKKALAALPPNP
jgi:tetratricopeptide (TPR) repeat protein